MGKFKNQSHLDKDITESTKFLVDQDYTIKCFSSDEEAEITDNSFIIEGSKIFGLLNNNYEVVDNKITINDEDTRFKIKKLYQERVIDKHYENLNESVKHNTNDLSFSDRIMLLHIKSQLKKYDNILKSNQENKKESLIAFLKHHHHFTKGTGLSLVCHPESERTYFMHSISNYVSDDDKVESILKLLLPDVIYKYQDPQGHIDLELSNNKIYENSNVDKILKTHLLVESKGNYHLEPV